MYIDDEPTNEEYKSAFGMARLAFLWLLWFAFSAAIAHVSGAYDIVPIILLVVGALPLVIILGAFG